jgi:hypothetical protein
VRYVVERIVDVVVKVTSLVSAVMLVLLVLSFTGCGVDEAEFSRDEKKKEPVVSHVCQTLPAKGHFVVYVQDGKILGLDEVP